MCSEIHYSANSLSTAVVAACLLCLTVSSSSAQTASIECPENPERSGTFTLQGETRSFFVGYRWGEGILTLNNGEEHKFSARGLKFGETGSSTVQIAGDVYGLEPLDDFEGDYVGTFGGVLPLIGQTDVLLVNSKCVTLAAKLVGTGWTVSLEADQTLAIKFENN